MTQIRERNQRLYDAADNAFTSEGGFVAPAAEESRSAMRAPALLEVPHETERAAAEVRQRVMEEASVSYDGRHYYYDGHRYTGLGDAVDHSILMRSRTPLEHLPGPFTMTPAVYIQTDADAELMTSLGISFVAGMYCYTDYRYEHLEDAAGYARLRRSMQ